MDDRALLEAAAKAAGIDLSKRHYLDGDGFGLCEGPLRAQTITFWNPLTDDGDALRLAVKLEMALDLTVAMQDGADVEANSSNEDCNDDPYAATRRAIVRAAAAMGA